MTGDGDTCLKDCDPPCDTCSECNQVLGQCQLMCGEEQCIDDFCLAGNCPAEEVVCQATSCSANGGAGSCVNTGDGVYCAKALTCGCATDLDCRNEGFGPNSRCADDCAFCAESGGFGCVTFAGDTN